MTFDDAYDWPVYQTPADDIPIAHYFGSQSFDIICDILLGFTLHIFSNLPQ